MDLFKKQNVKLATVFDYNADCVILKNRKSVSKMLNRYSRRKLKQRLNLQIKGSD